MTNKIIKQLSSETEITEEKFIREILSSIKPISENNKSKNNYAIDLLRKARRK